VTRSTVDNKAIGALSFERSRQASERARGLLPVGLARPPLHFEPHPVFAERGEGAFLLDIDGNRYLDLHNNFTALVLGHCHSRVISALGKQLALGTTFGAPTESEAALAQLIVDRVKSVERVTFTNSGTEAAAVAISLARAFTGRERIAKFEGGYHGWDATFLSVRERVGADHGPVDRPKTVRNSVGIPEAQANLVVTLPYNNIAAASDIVGRHARDLAAIVVEPIQNLGGGIVGEPAFLRGIEILARRFHIPLILDEVVTLRLAQGGAQELFGLSPDLTIMGKIIGGGLPVGGVGGRREILELLGSHGPNAVFQSGTYSGNPMSMAAGHATLSELTTGAIRQLNALGDELRLELETFCRRHELPVSITGVGSLLNIHFAAHSIRSSRDSWTEDKVKANAFLGEMLRNGFYMTRRCGISLSTPMTERNLEAFLSTSTQSLTQVCAG
jgi:glutamate-1-semialdehyde 2,1-aminomutase